MSKLVHEERVNNPYHDNKLYWPYHRARAETILSGQIPAPSLIEIDPTDEGCNQSCVFCCFGSGTHRKMRSIPVDPLLHFLSQAYDAGTYAFELVGGGEPTNHKEIAKIIQRIAALAKPGVERPHIGIVTNGVRLDRIFPVAEHLDFVRVGLDAPDAALYNTLHGIPSSSPHFTRMINNISTLVGKIGGKKVRLGYLVTPPYNYERGTILRAAELAHGLGVEHVAFRPAFSRTDATTEMWLEASEAVSFAKEKYSDGFILGGTAGSWPHVLGKELHPTGRCRTRPLVLVVKADGTIPSCFLYRERLAERPAIGTIFQQFADVWFSETHTRSLQEVNRSTCPEVCKLYRTERALSALESSDNKESLVLDDAELDDPHFI